MRTVEYIENWRGQDVLDADGEKAGRLDEVYYDATATEVVLFSVKHGLLGRQATLVPALEAVFSRDYVRVPYSAGQMQEAESGQVGDELTDEHVDAVAALYKVSLPSGPLHSASLIQRRRAEAEKADQRAHELQLDAERRARELDEAQQQASSAADEARAAELERERVESATPDQSAPSTH
jgi:sporulation protein YlmC with PRC-barrel domain